MEKKEEKNEVVGWLRDHKLLIGLGISLLILLLFISAKGWLYFQFILGNDIIIKVTTDKDYITLLHGEEDNITFTVNAKANTFCKAICFVQFEDLSTETSNVPENFSVQAGIPVTKTYGIQTPLYGEGYLLYRFDITCQGKQSALCHTKEEDTTRNVLVLVSYERTVSEDILREKLFPELNELAQTMTTTTNTLTESNRIRVLVDPYIITDEFQISLNLLQRNVTEQISKLEHLEQVWRAERYQSVKDEYVSFIPTASLYAQQAEEMFNNLTSMVAEYNEVIKKLNQSHHWLEELQQLYLLDDEQAQEIKQETEDFSSVQQFVSQRTSREQKQVVVDYIFNNTQNSYEAIPSAIQYETMTKIIQSDVDYELACRLNINCEKPSLQSSISKWENQTSVDAEKTCNDMAELHRFYEEIYNSSINGEGENGEGIIEVDKTKSTAIDTLLLFQNTKKEILQDYLEGLPLDAPDSLALKEIILTEINTTEIALANILAQENTTNMTNTTIEELLMRNQPAACEEVTTKLPALGPQPENILVVPERLGPLLNISFSLSSAQCCVFKQCNPCCNDPSCQNDPETFPLVFLHGHALSAETAADYSLDIFNDLQKELEQEGYINGGAISLTTSSSEAIPPLSVFNVPVTLKASYYLDLFQEQEDYVIVQTKSENIDTYAIRLKELIDTIQQRTGKPKIVIIAHSMGGLVARRYLQIFGTDAVAKLIVVGTPNKGIKGDVAKYCTVFGGELECRDMNANSLFMNKLNREEIPTIPIYNIVGTGCDMDGQQGDGIVLQEDALLEGAHTTLINGTCERFKLLHTELLNTARYPEVYTAIKKALE